MCRGPIVVLLAAIPRREESRAERERERERRQKTATRCITSASGVTLCYDALGQTEVASCKQRLAKSIVTFGVFSNDDAIKVVD